MSGLTSYVPEGLKLGRVQLDVSNVQAPSSGVCRR